MYDEEGRAASPPRFAPGPPSEVPRRAVPARQLAPPIEGIEPETYEHIRPGSVTPVSEEPRAAPGPGDPTRRGDRDEVPRGAPGEAPRGAPGEVPRDAPTPISREIPEPETHGHIRAESSTAPSEEEFPRDAPGAELPRAPTTRGVRDVTPRFPSGPDRLDYDDAERARYDRFGEIERQLADVTQDAAESEMRREHEFREREAERDRQFAEKQAERDRQFEESAGRDEIVPTRAPQPPPGAPLPGDVLGAPEPPESVVASIRRAAAESAARHADDIRDIVQGEREEMARQLEAEREEARLAREALEQQVLADRKRADDERDARMRELEEELARVRAELDHEKQQRDHDEEMRREAESQRNVERDEEMRQQLNEITDLLLAHRDEFARKEETVDERWREKQEWREETNRQFQGLFAMVQGIRDECAETKEKCEEERRAAAERPSKQKSLSFIPCIHLFSATQDIMDELLQLRESFETLTNSE